MVLIAKVFSSQLDSALNHHAHIAYVRKVLIAEQAAIHANDASSMQTCKMLYLMRATTRERTTKMRK